MRSLRSVGLLLLFVGAQLVALALALPFRSAGLATTNAATANNPAAPLYLVVLIVVAPLAILWLAKREGGIGALRMLLLGAIAASLYLTLGATFDLLIPGFYPPPPFLEGAQAASGPIFLSITLSGVAAAAILLALLIEPQWYIVDGAGFLAAGSLIAILGISFGPLPVFVLLGALAIYDYIAVYRTKHMLSLADVVVDMKLPILLVMPSAPGYDYPNAPPLKARAGPKERGEREAMFMGLGDVVIPGVLVVSSFIWLPTHAVIGGLGGNLAVALSTLLGALVGYVILVRQVDRGAAQAGLPFLNGGAIGAYLLAYLVFFHNLGFGFGFSF